MHVNLFFSIKSIKYTNDHFDDAKLPPPPKKNHNLTVVKVRLHYHNISDHLKINNHSITCSYSFPSLLINSSKMNNIFNYVYKDINSHNSI